MRAGIRAAWAGSKAVSCAPDPPSRGLNHDRWFDVVRIRTCPAAIRTRTGLHRYIAGAGSAENEPGGIFCGGDLLSSVPFSAKRSRQPLRRPGPRLPRRVQGRRSKPASAMTWSGRSAPTSHRSGFTRAVPRERSGARAFTRRESIHVAPGEYDPSSQSSRSLMGHELAQVVQMRPATTSSTTPTGSCYLVHPAEREEASIK